MGGLKEEQPEVGPKGAASGAMQVKDCREAAPKEEQGGKPCESNERERTSQITPINTDKGEKQGGAQGTCASASEPDSLTSELADGFSKTPLHSLRE